jgi:predicted Zn finger-like uncharacterized protein
MNHMVVQCSSCRTDFELDPVKVPANGVRARCSVCQAVISVPPPSQDGASPSPQASRQTPAMGVPTSVPAAADNTAVHKRPLNPFLTKDPGLRAKRLARALVSDIVAYHPAKHAEGLRDGTLKTLFRDEIKKSYDEYVDQVGDDFAQSTTHFQDALNDLLAAGKRLF